MRVTLYYVSIFTLILTSVFVGYLFYLSFYPFNIVSLHKFETIEKKVKRGEDLHYDLEFTKNIDYRADIKYFLVDGIILRLEDEGTHREVGSYIAHKTRQMPTTVNKGRYKLRIELDYEIAPWRHITYTWESNDFFIE